MAVPGRLFFGTSSVRRAILLRFFARPGLVRHGRELARELGRAPAVVARELRRLEEAGVLTADTLGRARRYRINERSPFAAEVRALVQKTFGVEARLAEVLSAVGGVEEAFLFGSYARGSDRATSDLDVMVIGRVDQEELWSRLVDLERELGRDINVDQYERGEFDRLRHSKDRFLAEVSASPRVKLLPANRRA